MTFTREQKWKVNNLIGEQIMGWKACNLTGTFIDRTSKPRLVIFRPTTELSDAFEALNMLYSWGYSWSIKNETGLPYKKGQEGITVSFGQVSATHDDLCIAICLAILYTLQVDIDALLTEKTGYTNLELW